MSRSFLSRTNKHFHQRSKISHNCQEIVGIRIVPLNPPLPQLHQKIHTISPLEARRREHEALVPSLSVAMGCRLRKSDHKHMLHLIYSMLLMEWVRILNLRLPVSSQKKSKRCVVSL